MGDLASIFGLSLLAMFNPTLLAAVTIMLLLPNPKRLMFGYLLGAYLTSISLGLLVVFSLHGSDSVDTARSALSPGADIAAGLLLLIAGFALRDPRVEQLREDRRSRRQAGREPKLSWPERMLGRGSARVTFAVGVVLTFPGVSYLTALDRIAKLDASTVPTILIVVVFCLIQQLLLEVPLVGYALAPAKTRQRVTSFREWLGRNGRRAAAGGAIAIGVLALIRGVVELLS